MEIPNHQAHVESELRCHIHIPQTPDAGRTEAWHDQAYPVAIEGFCEARAPQNNNYIATLIYIRARLVVGPRPEGSDWSWNP